MNEKTLRQIIAQHLVWDVDDEERRERIAERLSRDLVNRGFDTAPQGPPMGCGPEFQAAITGRDSMEGAS